MAYLGASPLSSFASPSKDRFSGNNSDTSFTMSQSVVDPNQIEVFVGNVRQEPNVAYTTSGTTLNLLVHHLVELITFMWFTNKV